MFVVNQGTADYIRHLKLLLKFISHYSFLILRGSSTLALYIFTKVFLTNKAMPVSK